MQSPPQTRSRMQTEDVVEVQPPHCIASQQTVQQPSPTAVPAPATPSSPVAWKRQRTAQAEPRVVRFVGGKFRPPDLKDIKNAKKRLAKQQTQEALHHKEIIYLRRGLNAYKGVRNEVWKVARGHIRLPVERRCTQPPDSLVAKMKGQVEDSPAVEEVCGFGSADAPASSEGPWVGSGGAADRPDIAGSAGPTDRFCCRATPPSTASAVEALGDMAAEG
ncbi:hypothetical protein Emag_007752 [Eimeria magna]